LGRRGPAPKPDKLKALEGNPGKRKLNLDAPEPEGIPTCPSGLSQTAKNEWRRVARELHNLGLLTRIDRSALAVYCDAYEKWIRATEILDREGLTMEYENKAGAVNIIARPEVNIATKYAQLVKSFCAEFGLTPSSRCRLLLPKDKETDQFEDDFG
jgi:P27 family predicted phage terminase small subunit